MSSNGLYKYTPYQYKLPEPLFVGPNKYENAELRWAIKPTKPQNPLSVYYGQRHINDNPLMNRSVKLPPKKEKNFFDRFYSQYPKRNFGIEPETQTLKF